MKNILCVCIGNSDRSPLMAAVLQMFLKNAGHDVNCESAGVGETAAKGTAAPFGVAAGKRIGLDFSGHQRRITSSLDLKQYDLIVCASDEIAGKVIEQGADLKKVYNAQVPNPWPVQFQQDFDSVTVPVILSAMYRIVAHYFSK